MEKVKVDKDFTIHLPKELRKIVSQGDEFMVAVVGDSIKLQRIKKPDICDLAATLGDENAPSLEEISSIVHKLRGVSVSETQSSN